MGSYLSCCPQKEKPAALPALCPACLVPCRRWHSGSCVASAFAELLGKLLHVFTCLAFHSMVWQCPQFEQLLAHRVAICSWCGEIRQDVISPAPQSFSAAQNHLGLQQAAPCELSYKHSAFIFLTAHLFTGQLRLMSGNDTAKTTRSMPRQK